MSRLPIRIEGDEPDTAGYPRTNPCACASCQRVKLSGDYEPTGNRAPCEPDVRAMIPEPVEPDPPSEPDRARPCGCVCLGLLLFWCLVLGTLLTIGT